jgi:hypothetical protein
MEKVLPLFGLTFSSKSTGLLLCTLSYKVESSELIVLIVVMVKIDQLYSDWICWFSVYSVQSVHYLYLEYTYYLGKYLATTQTPRVYSENTYCLVQ